MVEAIDMSNATLVMSGELQEFSLADVLQVVGLSRQSTVVEVRRDGGSSLGTAWIKSGRVIRAQSQDVSGRPAFHRLFDPNGHRFIVHRVPDPPSYPAPLGLLTSLLADALARASRAEAAPTHPTTTTTTITTTTTTAAPVATRPRGTGPVEAPVVRLVEPARLPVTPEPGRDGGVVVAIASPKGGVGKTTVTLNLAVALATRGIKTLVIDADINGDLLSLLAARDRVQRGTYDVLGRPDVDAAFADVVRNTAAATLRIVPASGDAPPAGGARRSSAAWKALLSRARREATVVLVDCPAGMYDGTADVLAGCDHVVGVVQSEMIAGRSVGHLSRSLDALPDDARPNLLGVVVNMFHGRSLPSVEAFHAIASDRVGAVLFETPIPRSDAFGAASRAGLPLRLADAHSGPSPVAWLFDMLAEELCQRLRIAPAAHGAVDRFLL